ncbi:MAG: redoxin family protein [Myxococcota bacterium]
MNRSVPHLFAGLALLSALGGLAACDSGGGDDPPATLGEGDLYPAVSVLDCEGREVALRDRLAAHAVTYVSFGAQWCTACAEETPVINAQLVDGLADEDVGVIQILIEGAAGDPPPLSLCAGWQSDLGARYTVLVDTRQENLAPFFGTAIGTLPLHLVVTQDGMIRFKKLGAIPSDIQAIVAGWLPQ